MKTQSPGDRVQTPEGAGPPPLPRGELIAPDYRVFGLLRRGRDLDTYDLWSESRRCRCVGKVVRPDRLDRSDARARLGREGNLLLGLSHPHIVRAYEVQTEPAPLVVLETLPGETLSRLIHRRRKALSAQEIAHLGLHLCSAIAYLHHSSILHLDLKPSNIIAMHGMAKVIDLSLARPPGPHRGGIGTRGYRAPEQSMGGDLGVSTDVWGIGATLYEVAAMQPACAVGDEPPVSGPESDFCRPTPIRRVRRLTPALACAIDCCLSVDPESRPAVAELAANLESIVQAARESSQRRAATAEVAFCPSLDGQAARRDFVSAATS